MNRLFHKILYRILPLKLYLIVVSRLLFILQKIGWGRYNPATEYIYHLDKLVDEGDVVIDIGANLGYYTRPLSQRVGAKGLVYAVEPVPPIFEVLHFNTRKCSNVKLMNVALGCENGTVKMANVSVASTGYFGTGQNFVQDKEDTSAITFTALMQRGSELFSSITRLDFIKCDIEGYEVVVFNEIRPIIEKFRPIVLLESGEDKRVEMIEMFKGMNYDAFTLEKGEEVPLTPSSGKDIIFRPRKR